MRSLLPLLLLALSAPALADITITDAWARATPPGARTAAVYFTVVNDGEAPDALVGAATEASDLAELHTHVHADGMMQMKQVPAIDVPAGGEAVLKPHGDHLMLVGLHGALAPGESLELTLSFEHHAQVTVSVPIRDARKP